MKKEEIDKAFEGRWRIKGFDSYEVRQLSGKDVKTLCRDFFEAGICLGEEHCQPNPISAIMDAASEVAFEEWWDMYGKKVDRKKCIKKWKNLTYNEKQLCLNATPAYVASTPDVVFRKNPLTYLNGECWNDEIIIKDNGTNKPTPEQQRFKKLASILTD